MRYDAEHKRKTRLRVLDEAAMAIREEGPHRLGVAGVMARAGLTHGGFYAHFPSKEAFVSEAIAHMFEGGPTAMLEKVKGAYLFLGNGDSAGLHNSRYDFNDALLERGPVFLHALARRFLA